MSLRGELTALTQRERQIATMRTQGAMRKNIATDLHISDQTVRNHIRNIYRKLGCSTVQELAAKLNTNGSGAECADQA